LPNQGKLTEGYGDGGSRELKPDMASATAAAEAVAAVEAAKSAAKKNGNDANGKDGNGKQLVVSSATTSGAGAGAGASASPPKGSNRVKPKSGPPGMSKEDFVARLDVDIKLYRSIDPVAIKLTQAERDTLSTIENDLELRICMERLFMWVVGAGGGLEKAYRTIENFGKKPKEKKPATPASPAKAITSGGSPGEKAADGGVAKVQTTKSTSPKGVTNLKSASSPRNASSSPMKHTSTSSPMKKSMTSTSTHSSVTPSKSGVTPSKSGAGLSSPDAPEMLASPGGTTLKCASKGKGKGKGVTKVGSLKRSLSTLHGGTEVASGEAILNPTKSVNKEESILNCTTPTV
jgi:hypothetical protein